LPPSTTMISWGRWRRSKDNVSARQLSSLRVGMITETLTTGFLPGGQGSHVRTMVSRRPAFSLHPLRPLLHGGAGLCLGERGRNRGYRRLPRRVVGPDRSSVYAFRGPAAQLEGKGQRRLYLLRPGRGLYHLSGAAAAVPDLAVLGK